MPHDPEVLHVGICDCDVPGRGDVRATEKRLQERIDALESAIRMHHDDLFASGVLEPNEEDWELWAIVGIARGGWDRD